MVNVIQILLFKCPCVGMAHKNNKQIPTEHKQKFKRKETITDP
jgi:hypothetical protein